MLDFRLAEETARSGEPLRFVVIFLIVAGVDCLAWSNGASLSVNLESSCSGRSSTSVDVVELAFRRVWV